MWPNYLLKENFLQNPQFRLVLMLVGFYKGQLKEIDEDHRSISRSIKIDLEIDLKFLCGAFKGD